MKHSTIASATLGALIVALAAGCSALFSRPDTHTPVEPAELGKTFTPAELEEDLRFVRQVIEEVHPRPHERLSNEALDARVEVLAARIDRPMTRVEFWPIAAELAASLGDAHTSVGGPSEEWNQFVRDGGLILPFGVEARDGAVVVLWSKVPEGGPPIGAKVLRIDDVDMSELVAAWEKQRAGRPEFAMGSLVGAMQYHLWRLGARAPFDVVVEGANGPVTYPALAGVTLQSVTGRSAETPKPPNWSFAWLDGDVAYIDFRVMYEEDAWESFLDQTFAEMRARPAAGLIVDLRRNGGGNASLGNTLVSYLTDKPARSCARKEWRSSARYRAYMKQHVPWWLRWLPLQWFHPFGRKFWGVDEGDIVVFDFEAEAPEPKALRYDGPWCLLIGPGTFSSAMMLANTVGDFELAPMFGAEAGQSPNECGDLYPCDLPHTRLQLNVSSARFVRANGDDADPHVLPTHPIESTPEDRRAGRDTVLEAAKEWIRAQSGSSAPTTTHAVSRHP